MRIAVFHNLPSGGAKRAVYEWTRYLAKGNSIDVYSLSTANHSFCDIRPFAQTHKVYHFSPNGLFKSPFGRLNQLLRWRELGNLDQLHRKIAAEINTSGYEILFANTCIFTFIPILLQYIEIPSVYYLHEPFGPGFIRSFERSYIINNPWHVGLDHFDPLISLYNNRLASLQLKSIHNTKRLLANSNFTREQMQKTYGIETKICPCGVDLVSFNIVPGIKKENYVISVGELSPRKGFDFVINSLGKIPSEYRPQLILACNSVDSRENEYIANLAKFCGVDLKVLTNLDTDQLRLLYNQARMCIYTPVLEPFGLVPLESMACGTPVVGVREGGVQESIVHGYNGLLIDRNVEEFATAIQWLLNRSDIAENYGRNGRTYVLTNWTWEQSGSTLFDNLEACIGKFDSSSLHCTATT